MDLNKSNIYNFSLIRTPKILTGDVEMCDILVHLQKVCKQFGSFVSKVIVRCILYNIIKRYMLSY